ncbi:MAG: ATP-binding protein, partial [Phototrophicaceae bacterium]
MSIDQHIEIVAVNAAGEEFPVELTVIPTEIDGKTAFLSFVRDISERKRNENGLLRTSARLEQLIANLQGGILVEDETRHIVLVNEAFCSMFGLPATPEQLYGADCSTSAEQTKGMFVDPQTFVSRIDTLLRDRQLAVNERLFLADGRVFLRDYVPIFHKGEYLGHLWHYSDISDEVEARRRAERLLALEEMNKGIIRRFLQLDNIDEALTQTLAITGEMLNVSRVYVFHFRENERLLDNTHEWCASGVLPEIDNLKGLPYDELVPSFFPLLAQEGKIAPDHINELPSDIHDILAPQNIQSVLILPLYANERIEGFIGYDEVRSARHWLPEEITTVRIIAESYSRALERERTERTLIEARDEARRTATLRTQLVANISHEIRTPMTGMLGMLELLIETELDELQLEFASEALMSSKRLLGIVSDIFEFARLESGEVALESDALDLKAVVTEVQMTFLPEARAKALNITTQFDLRLPRRVQGDPARLRQALIQLVKNAVKFTAQGSITLSVQLGGMADGIGQIHFQVQDTGIGIAQEHQQQIFESFVQADGSITRKYGGNGIGLSIFKQLVELMGGQVGVQSELGKGSNFYFTIPLPILEAAEPAALHLPDLSALQVIVVDANRTARYVLMQHLENWGITVQGGDTLPAMPEQPYDLLFCRPAFLAQAQPLAYTTIPIGEASLQAPNATFLIWPIDLSQLQAVLLAAHQRQSSASTVTPSNPILGRVLLAEDYPLNVNLVKSVLSALNIGQVIVNGRKRTLRGFTKG